MEQSWHSAGNSRAACSKVSLRLLEICVSAPESESWGINKATCFIHDWIGFEAIKRYVSDLKRKEF